MYHKRGDRSDFPLDFHHQKRTKTDPKQSVYDRNFSKIHENQKVNKRAIKNERIENI
jgi:hypothetical protein